MPREDISRGSFFDRKVIRASDAIMTLWAALAFRGYFRREPSAKKAPRAVSHNRESDAYFIPRFIAVVCYLRVAPAPVSAVISLFRS